jgi:hypothetical protein
MDADYLRRHIPALTAILLLMILVLGAAKALLMEPVRAPAHWKGYDVYLVDMNGDAAAQEVASVLREAGYERVVRRGSQTVSMFTYDGLEEFSLDEIDNYFLERDPLRDPYVDTLERYYQGRIGNRSAEVLYAQRGELSFLDHLQVRRTLNGLDVHWARPGAGPVALMLLAGGSIGFLLLLCLGVAGRFSPLVMFSLLPLLPGVLVPEYAYTVGALFLVFGFALLARIGVPVLRMYLNRPEDLRRRAFLQPAGAYVLCLSAALVYPVLSSASAPVAGHLLLAAGMQLLVAALFALQEIRRYTGQQHRLFYPVTMAGRPRREIRPSFTAAVPALIFLLGLPFALDSVDAGAKQLRFPVPQTAAYGSEPSGDPGFESLYKAYKQRGQLTTDSESEYLPTLGDYVAHMAYQEGYLYGRGYGFPEPGERVTLRTYEGTGMEVEADEKVMKMFTDDWYEDIIAKARQKGIERVLYTQGAPLLASTTTVESLRITGPLKKGHVALMAMLSLFLLLMRSWNIRSMYVSGSGQGDGERRKVA